MQDNDPQNQNTAASPASAALPSAAAIAGAGDGEIIAGEIVLPSIPVDDLLDDHATELEEIRRWASSETGQAARMENPIGFANVRALATQQQSAAIAAPSAVRRTTNR